MNAHTQQNHYTIIQNYGHLLMLHNNIIDIPTMLAIKEDLLNSVMTETSKSHLLAAFAEESGIWLNWP